MPVKVQALEFTHESSLGYKKAGDESEANLELKFVVPVITKLLIVATKIFE